MTEATTKPVKLESWHLDLLRVLEERGAWTAGTIGKKVWTSATARQAASTATPHLKALEAWGLAKRMDDDRPVLWLRTPAGTAELAGRAHPAVAKA